MRSPEAAPWLRRVVRVQEWAIYFAKEKKRMPGGAESVRGSSDWESRVSIVGIWDEMHLFRSHNYRVYPDRSSVETPSIRGISWVRSALLPLACTGHTPLGLFWSSLSACLSVCCKLLTSSQKIHCKMSLCICEFLELVTRSCLFKKKKKKGRQLWY